MKFEKILKWAIGTGVLIIVISAVILAYSAKHRLGFSPYVEPMIGIDTSGVSGLKENSSAWSNYRDPRNGFTFSFPRDMQIEVVRDDGLIGSNHVLILKLISDSIEGYIYMNYGGKGDGDIYKTEQIVIGTTTTDLIFQETFLHGKPTIHLQSHTIYNPKGNNFEFNFYYSKNNDQEQVVKKIISSFEPFTQVVF